MSGAAFTLEARGDLRVLRFDLPGEKVNLLRAETMDELDARLDEIARNRGARALLIESGKPDSFIAGADVHAIAALADRATAEAAARRGQAIFDRLATLPIPSVALIHGACVGGGLELALACTWRIASTDPATKLGLPEVLLGIVPGFGGTQRLPRTVGLLQALPLLLTGKSVSARAAWKLGLVDEIAPAGSLRAAAERVLAQRPPRGPRGRGARIVEAALRVLPLLRRRVHARAAAAIRARTGEQYPAPLRMLEAVEAAYAGDFSAEARLLAELVTGDVSRHLVRLFQLSESARSQASETWSGERRVFVAGAGQMGSAIAAQFVGSGLRTRLHDALPPALAGGVARASESVRRRFREDREGLRAALDRLEPSVGRDGIKNCDLFLEAVVERVEVKRELLQAVEPLLPPAALIATNTSSLDLDELSVGLARPERFVGLHFFHPVERMRLVEVVRGGSTSPQTVADACAVARRLGKVPIVVANRPGFLVNRLLAPYLLEAERLVGEGAPIAAVDAALKAAGMPMGPLELLDEIGLDVAEHVAGTMRAAFPDRFDDAGVVRRLRAGGALGKKNGRGFYLHGRTLQPNPDAQGAGRTAADERNWVGRLLEPVVAEARRCLDEQVVAGPDDVDLAMMLGAGFLLPHGGPLRWAARRRD